MTAVPGGGVQLDPVPAGAIRRTTTLAIRPHDSWAASRTLTAIGRDLVRSDDGSVRSDHDELTFDIDPAGAIVPISGARGVPAQLWGRSVHRGLRKDVAQLRGTQQDGGVALLGPAGGLLDAMLDDVVGATLASGYGRLDESARDRARRPGSEAIGTDDLASRMRLTCVGFATMHERGERFDVRRYFDTKPASAELVPPGALAWHEDQAMQPRSFRRRRLLQVAPASAGGVAVTGYFRDTFMTAEGVEKVVHEYGLSATVSGPTLILDSIEATPGDLPLDHCPLAARSALHLVGLPLAQVDEIVRRDIAGPGACTHLNDELRNLRLVPALLALSPGRQIRT